MDRPWNKTVTTMKEILVRKLNLNGLIPVMRSKTRFGRWAAALAVAALTTGAVLAFAGRSYSLREKSSSSVARPETAETAIKLAEGFSAIPTARLQTEVITILPDGFEPSQITRPFGRVFLLVENHSGLGEVSLALEREAGAHLLDVQVPREKLGWSDLIDLTPGEYVLTEANHADWVCKITITPK